MGQERLCGQGGEQPGPVEPVGFWMTLTSTLSEMRSPGTIESQGGTQSDSHCTHSPWVLC